jgi:hypothetical protein
MNLSSVRRRSICCLFDARKEKTKLAYVLPIYEYIHWKFFSYMDYPVAPILKFELVFLVRLCRSKTIITIHCQRKIVVITFKTIDTN